MKNISRMVSLGISFFPSSRITMDVSVCLEFVEKIRFLMMAKDKDFTDYYSSRTLTKEEFYSVADTLYALNNLWMLSGFIRQNPLLHPVPLQDNLWHIFPTPCCK